MRRAVIYLRVSTLDQTTANQERELREIAGRMGCEIVKVYKDHGISGTRGRVIVRERIPALAVGADPFLDNNRDRIIALAARHAVPTMYQFREQAISGGLASYGVDTADVYRQVGGYVARILKGESPANLPILEPTKFEFILNLKSAKALGLAIRPDVLSIADEVIE
jgi:putative tryptophan/tyrosine transport system substrate-binding protein